jgi:hypothetical protein
MVEGVGDHPLADLAKRSAGGKKPSSAAALVTPPHAFPEKHSDRILVFTRNISGGFHAVEEGAFTQGHLAEHSD